MSKPAWLGAAAAALLLAAAAWYAAGAGWLAPLAERLREQLPELLGELPGHLGGHMRLSVAALAVGLAVSLPWMTLLAGTALFAIGACVFVLSSGRYANTEELHPDP